jgi:hypothetical protein
MNGFDSRQFYINFNITILPKKTMQEYAENVLILYVESVVDEYPLNRKDQKALYLFDVVAAHKTDSFKDKLDDNDIKIRFVHASCTGELVTGEDTKNITTFQIQTLIVKTT